MLCISSISSYFFGGQKNLLVNDYIVDNVQAISCKSLRSILEEIITKYC